MFSLSRSERSFLIDGIDKNVRSDGRGRLEYRPLQLSIGVVPAAHGSARVILEETNVVVGVKLEVAEPNTQTPRDGFIVCNVECSSTASDQFRGQGSQDANTELTSALQRIFESSIDLESLCIIPGRLVWAIYIDAEIVSTDGSALDAISIGVRAAVKTAQVPCLRLTGNSSSPQEQDFEVMPDPVDSTQLLADLTPVCISLTKIGKRFVADVTVQEELCMTAQIGVAVNINGDICGVVKLGSGSLSPAGILDSISYAKKIGTALIRKVDDMLLKTGTHN